MPNDIRLLSTAADKENQVWLQKILLELQKYKETGFMLIASPQFITKSDADTMNFPVTFYTRGIPPDKIAECLEYCLKKNREQDVKKISNIILMDGKPFPQA
jgi:hypothetical protein